MKKGWEECTLEEYIKFIDYRGRTPIKTESGVRLITAKNVKNGYLSLEPQEFISLNDYSSWMTRGIPNYGDIIFTTEAPLGNVAQITTKEKLAFAQRIIVMQPDKTKINQAFLKYLLLSENIRSKIFEKGTGATVIGIKSSLLKKIPISIPSIFEQRQIVTILDDAFAAIEQARVNTEKNLHNTKRLFESYLQNIFINPGEEWDKKKLGDLAVVKSGGTPSRAKKEYWSGNIAWYSSGELNNLHTENPERYINQLAVQNSNAKLFPKGSLLIGMYDTAALKMSILDREATFNQAIAGVKPNDKINIQFILHAINAIKPELLELRRGVRQKNLSLEKIKDISIAFPHINNQKAIVDKLTDFANETQKLHRSYLKKLILIEELKKSILQKAFSGELNLSTEKILA